MTLYTLLLVVISVTSGLTATTTFEVEGFTSKTDCELVLDYMESQVENLGIVVVAGCTAVSVDS